MKTVGIILGSLCLAIGILSTFVTGVESAFQATQVAVQVSAWFLGGILIALLTR